MTVTFSPILPGWLIVLIAVALGLLLIQGSRMLIRRAVPTRWIGYLAAFRVVAILLLLACLLRPVIRFTRHVTPEPALLMLIDASESMRRTPAEGQASTVLVQTVSALDQSGLPAEAARAYDVHAYAVDRYARTVAGDLAAIAADGAATELADALRSAVLLYRQQQAGQGAAVGEGAARGDQALRVMLVSDGHDQGREDVAAAAAELGVTVDVLPAAPAAPPAAEDLAWVAGVQSPRRVLLGSEYRLDATIRQQGNYGRPLVLELLEDGAPVVSFELGLDADEKERAVRLTYRPTTPGEKHYRLALRPAEADEALGEPYELALTVEAQGTQVLMLEDSWRWELRYLKRVLEDDPSFAVTAFQSRAPGIYMQYAEPDRSVKLSGFPQSRAELEWFDVIVLGDVKPSTWPPGMATALYRLVVEQGKSLVVIAGPGTVQLAQIPALAPLLPVEMTGPGAGGIPGPMTLELTAQGAASPLFYRPPGQGHDIAWSALPVMDQIYAPLRKKPAATILMHAAESSNAYGPAIVLAEHTVGRGRVLYVGSDTLWKWHMLGPADPQGATAYSILWQQAMRWLAPGISAGGDTKIALATDRTRYQRGESVTVQARIESSQPVQALQLHGTVALPDGRQLPVTLLRDSADPSLYRATLEASQSGRYRITATLQNDGTQVGDAVTSMDVIDISAEQEAPSEPNLAGLTRIAAQTGGQVIELANQETWPRPTVAAMAPVETTAALNLWSNFTLLILLVLVLGVDWLIRLLRGFV